MTTLRINKDQYLNLFETYTRAQLEEIAEKYEEVAERQFTEGFDAGEKIAHLEGTVLK